MMGRVMRIRGTLVLEDFEFALGGCDEFMPPDRIFVSERGVFFIDKGIGHWVVFVLQHLAICD